MHFLLETEIPCSILFPFFIFLEVDSEKGTLAILFLPRQSHSSLRDSQFCNAITGTIISFLVSNSCALWK